MKNKLVGALTSIAASALLAGSVNSPASSAQFESGLFTGAQQDYTVRVGVVNEVVKDRKLRDKPSKTNIDKATITRDGVALTLGIYDRLEVSFAGGAAEMSTMTGGTTDGGTGSVSTEARDGSFWTFGASGIVYSFDNATVNAFADYSTMRANINNVGKDGTFSGFTSAKRKGKEWRVGVGVAQDIAISPDAKIVPGLAIYYSDAKFTTTNGTIGGPAVTLNELEARGNFGVEVTCGIFAGKMFGLTFGAGYGDQTKLGFTAEMRI